MSLDGKVAIVTGGAGYIGSTTARRLARDGATVVIADVVSDLGQQVADSIVADCGRAIAIATNVREVASIEAMVQQVVDSSGRIDILVTVAGGSARGRSSQVAGSQVEVVEEVIDINLFGMIWACRAVVPHMIAQGSGKIVSVASIVGVQGLAGHADYAAAKGGVIAYAKSLAMEVAPHNINVNCVSPGLVPRPGTATDSIPKTNFLGRVADAETVSNVIAFLVSGEADFVVGQNYIVDGGRGLGLHGSS